MRSALAAVVLSVITFAGCGDDPARGATEPTAASEVSSVLADGAVVIDVRTPSEFAAGHVTDALNIDVASDDFEAKVDALDKGETYVVYCRTGSRAARAIETMKHLGFDNLVNGGAFDELVAAGVPTS
ncbi:MAG TPA: rhodanese-like domain-containing protein [Marmoricola sp.]|nr:rhodanese-like domain-containing protein [Marmoricola sp.]